MKTETFLRKLSVALAAAVLVIGASACSHHSATAGQDYGHVRTEASATESTSSDQVVGTAPAPSNAQNIEGTTTPAVISGPAKVDSSGRAYTSSSVGSTGNSSATGLNTNVNIIPEKSSSNVTVTQSPAVTTDTTTQTTITESTTAPVTTDTTAQTTITETTPVTTQSSSSTTITESAPMTSSTQQSNTNDTSMSSQSTSTTDTTTSTTSTQSTTTHRRMRKD